MCKGADAPACITDNVAQQELLNIDFVAPQFQPTVQDQTSNGYTMTLGLDQFVGDPIY